jgi:hypothetical protein
MSQLILSIFFDAKNTSMRPKGRVGQSRVDTMLAAWILLLGRKIPVELSRFLWWFILQGDEGPTKFGECIMVSSNFLNNKTFV